MALVRWVGRAIGLDVHRDFCVVAICEDGEVRSAGRVPSTPEGLAMLAESLLPSDRVAEVRDFAVFASSDRGEAGEAPMGEPAASSSSGSPVLSSGSYSSGWSWARPCSGRSSAGRESWTSSRPAT